MIFQSCIWLETSFSGWWPPTARSVVQLLSFRALSPCSGITMIITPIEIILKNNLTFSLQEQLEHQVQLWPPCWPTYQVISLFSVSFKVLYTLEIGNMGYCMMSWLKVDYPGSKNMRYVLILQNFLHLQVPPVHSWRLLYNRPRWGRPGARRGSTSPPPSS